jgi:hypothetical protein
MKKAFIIILIAVTTILAVWVAALGYSGAPRTWTPGSFINLYAIDGHIAAGLKERLFGRFYAQANVQYQETSADLEMQAGLSYLLPVKVLFFRFYGGTGFQFSRNRGYQYPYLSMGTDFLFFFSEVIYPMRTGLSPQVRGGFSFHF